VTYLLDVNILIALLDQDHPYHDIAGGWFSTEGAQSWATCPLTENAVLRILGHARYPMGPGTPTGAAELLRDIRGFGGHVFWGDEISLLDAPQLRLAALGTAGQVTDTYLLALAVHRGGTLATLDRRLTPHAVIGGSEALLILN
jgi:toxin-antitoxin system PIN domain toxin